MSAQKRMTYEAAAIEVIRRNGLEGIWAGNPESWGAIYILRNGELMKHPRAQWEAVQRALRRSPRFKVEKILSVAWAGVERWHTYFVLLEVEN